MKEKRKESTNSVDIWGIARAILLFSILKCGSCVHCNHEFNYLYTLSAVSAYCSLFFVHILCTRKIAANAFPYRSLYRVLSKTKTKTTTENITTKVALKLPKHTCVHLSRECTIYNVPTAIIAK